MEPQRSSDSPPPPATELIVGRKRASTISYKPPKPESSPDGYTPDRIQVGIAYATQRLQSKTRKPSPNSEKILVLYRGACEEYLEHEEAGFKNVKKIDLLSEIRSMESDLCTKNWLQVADSHKSQILQEDLIRFRKLEYYARYGDYAQRLAHSLRKETGSKKTEGWELLSGAKQWSDISDAIQGEAEWWKKYGSSKGTEEVQHIYAVYLGCMDIGIDYNRMIQTIHTYGARNTAFHSLIPKLIAEGQFGKVADILYNDLQELSSIMPPDLEEEEDFMRATLLELRDKWFKRDYNPDAPFGWTPTDELVAYWKDLSESPKKSEESRLKHAINVEQGVLRRLKEVEEEDTVIQQVRSKFDETSLPDAGPLPKRKASDSLSNSEPKLKKLKKTREEVWECIMTQQKQAKGTFRQSLEKQRQVNRLVSQYTAKWGISPPPKDRTPERDLPS
ncbi:MAG: hypothetical protein M1839_003843 [Geoglossum umbratile]|nr:MAG: hypothetical protein M1839_003843 [Geoglossum umbratile]